MNTQRKCIYYSDRFEVAFEEMLSTFKSKSNYSKNNYRSVVLSVCEYCKKDFLELSPEDLEAYYGTIGHLSESTRNQRMSILRSVSRYMDAKFNTNLLQTLAGVSIDQRKIYIEYEDLPEYADIDKVMQILKADGNITVFAICAIALETGLGLSDILSLNCGNFIVDKNNRAAIRIEPKVNGANTRFIPLQEETSKLIDDIGRGYNSTTQKLGERIVFTGTDPIFQSSHGDRISDRVVQKHMHAACKKAQVNPFGVNSLTTLGRASMLKNGAKVEALAESLDVTGTWFFHLRDVIKSLDDAPATYNHFRIVW